MINGPEVPPVSGAKPKSLIIFIHGYGSNGYNFIDIARLISRHLPDTQFLAPNAIERFELDILTDGYQWFSLLDRNPEVIEKLAKKAAVKLNEYIDYNLIKFDLKPENVILFSFSQGTMMSLYTALRRDKPVAGIFAFSGRLIAQKSTPKEIVSKPPVFLYHGDEDDVVLYHEMADAEAILKENAVNVSSYTMHNAGHEITFDAIEDALDKIKILLKVNK